MLHTSVKRSDGGVDVFRVEPVNPRVPVDLKDEKTFRRRHICSYPAGRDAAKLGQELAERLSS